MGRKRSGIYINPRKLKAQLALKGLKAYEISKENHYTESFIAHMAHEGYVTKAGLEVLAKYGIFPEDII